MENKGFQLNWISKYRDELFGIAILMVMLFHFSIIHLGVYKDSESTFTALIRLFNKQFGSGGVDIFVFLSGMGLYYSFSKNPGIGSFYARRYKRILIPYIIVGGIFWVHVDIFFRAAGFERFLKDFFYVTFVTEGVDNLWFISFIAVLYLIFPLLYKAIYGNRFGVIMFLLIMAAALYLPFAVSDNYPDLYHNIERALTRIPVFVAGIASARAIKENKAIPHIAAIGLIAICFCCRYYAVVNGIKGSFKRYSAAMLAMGVMLILVYTLRLLDKAKIIRKILCFFGRYSLEFYLLHILMWELAGERGMPIHRARGYAVLVLICCILAPALGKLTGLISGLLSFEKQGS